MITRVVLVWSLIFLATSFPRGTACAQDAQELVEASFNYLRGRTSIALVDIIIHRPAWERVMTMKAWTQGQDKSLIKIIAPARDKGNGTLKKGREMWIFNPKVNRVIKIPPSMMSQAWMGSDFSNNDLAKSDSLIKDYVHRIIGTEVNEGKKVYIIESMPKPDAPVVWGMQRLKIREDLIFLEEGFLDEDLKLVKRLTAHDIGILGGKLFPRIWKMEKADSKDEYTLLKYRELVFDRPLPRDTFTLSKLRLPVR
ncbi:MAG: outer membrane lipoprotein-sorting protein [Deltaproteobacteria bacterium]|nr:outer membrane lipoprotein-sorting protein [Deltaproteobacteria bacterium]